MGELLKVADGWKYRVIVVDQDGENATDDVNSIEQTGYAAQNLAEELADKKHDKEQEVEEKINDPGIITGKGKKEEEPDIPY